MRVAAADIGTNTVLLLVAEIGAGGALTVIREEQRMPRLGRGVDREKALPMTAAAVLSGILEEYGRIARAEGAAAIAACGTSALREATNRESFVADVERRTGIRIEVVSGRREALLTYAGALSDDGLGEGPWTVIDIGGGSTEITYRGAAGMVALSLPLGAVRLTERHLAQTPPSSGEVARARAEIAAAAALIGAPPPHRLIGVAGTATTLACLDAGLARFDAAVVRGYRLPLDRVISWSERLCALSSQEIGALTGAAEGRADILAAGTLILRGVMEYCGSPELTVSERGLRYGLALRAAGFPEER